MSRSGDLVGAITAASQKVYRTLGPGYEESVYQKALAVEFRKRSLSYQIEKNVEVLYGGVSVGVHRIDFIVEDMVVLELKAQPKITESHVAQARAYLKNVGMRVGMVINFSQLVESSQPQIEILETQAAVEPTRMVQTWSQPEKIG